MRGRGGCRASLHLHGPGGRLLPQVVDFKGVHRVGAGVANHCTKKAVPAPSSVSKGSIMQWSRLVLACAVGLGAAGVASAQSTWSVKTTSNGGTCTQKAANSGNYGNSYGCTGAVVSGGTAAGSAATEIGRAHV